MDPVSIQMLLKELREELKNIQEAIAVLERLSLGSGSRRGRPPAWLVEAKSRRQNECLTNSKSMIDGVQGRLAASDDES